MAHVNGLRQSRSLGFTLSLRGWLDRRNGSAYRRVRECGRCRSIATAATRQSGMCLIIADIFHNNAARMAPTDPGQAKSVLTVRIADPDVTPMLTHHLTASKPLRERRSARPASFPVGTPSDSAGCPFTRTCRIPVAYALGLSYVARSST